MYLRGRGRGLGNTYSHVGVDVQSVWRELGVFGGVDEEVVDTGIGFVEFFDAGNGVPDGAVYHGRVEND